MLRRPANSVKYEFPLVKANGLGCLQSRQFLTLSADAEDLTPWPRRRTVKALIGTQQPPEAQEFKRLLEAPGGLSGPQLLERIEHGYDG